MRSWLAPSRASVCGVSGAIGQRRSGSPDRRSSSRNVDIRPMRRTIALSDNTAIPFEREVKVKVASLEDDVAQARQIEALLTLDGHEVVPFNEGRKLIRYLESDKVDLLMLDWQGPEISGLGERHLVRWRPRGGTPGAVSWE